ncbi:long-chain fatty acid--CoA ligase [Falsiphaeobacter marinintestinus]|uniref:long-chain fatty acid--CoA ligase n=1 Tax=Falsiphaeobacter marinintestinus TaxID=1492905 RepID=UPI0011B3C102|nr:long-chain fatty acid--CoA ligase [Phaeobacter marinintestinus]
MGGKMMHKQLNVSSLVAHAARYHGATEVVSVETDGSTTRTNWAGIDAKARQLASGLDKLGVTDGARLGTLAWNNRRHLEIYFGGAGSGRVTHTINPRLTPEQMTYIINDAADEVLFFDATFTPMVAKLKPHLGSVHHFVLMGPPDAAAAEAIEGLLFYDDLTDGGDPDYVWPEIDETRASGLCYTSGTTGNPKGVEYTHRSTILHTLGANTVDGLALSATDTLLPVVPMFHANAWGVPYAAAAVGARVVLPGPDLSGPHLVKLIDEERVTMSLGVPTIWMMLLDALKETGSKAASMTRTLVGGSALPPSMIPEFRDNFGVDLVHAWGMTETSPLGSLNQLLQKHSDMTEAEKEVIRRGQGRPPWGVELRIVDENGEVLPEDGEAQGELHIRGHWIIDTYYGKGEDALTDDGWFDTGDVASIDADGYLIIRDRSKDIIKSGGEWISTVELENIAIAHPGIANAAAIAAMHEKWAERPVVIAVPVPGQAPSEEELIAFYNEKVAGWQMPDKIIFVDELPVGATGKVQKNKLREAYGDVLMAPAG